MNSAPTRKRLHSEAGSAAELLAALMLGGQLAVVFGTIFAESAAASASVPLAGLLGALAYPAPLAIGLLVWVLSWRRVLVYVSRGSSWVGLALGAAAFYLWLAAIFLIGSRLLGLDDFLPWALIGAALGAYPLVRFGSRLANRHLAATVIPGMLAAVGVTAAIQVRYKLWQSIGGGFLDPSALLLFVVTAMALGAGIALAPLFSEKGVPLKAYRLARHVVGAGFLVAALVLAWLNRVQLVPRLYLEVHLALAFFEWVLLIGAWGWLRPFLRSSSRFSAGIGAATVALVTAAGVVLGTGAVPVGQPVPRRVDYAAQFFATPWALAADADDDGFISTHLGGRDCDDGAAEVHPLGTRGACISGTLADTPDSSPLTASPDAPAADLTIVVTIDMLRPDFMGVYGSAQPTTPFLSETREQWVRFERAYTSGGITTLGLPSLLTGRLPMAIDFETVFRTTENRYVFPEDRRPQDVINRAFLSPRSDTHPTLASVFRDAGRATFAVVDDGPARVFQKGFGFERGFDHFYYPNAPEGPGQDVWGLDQVTEKSMEVVEQAPSGSLIWIHYYDPHAAYPPCQRFDTTPGLGCYRDAIYDVDQALAEIADRLHALDRWRRSAIFVTSDHGEALGEHGLDHHGLDSFEEFVRIPLLAKFPGAKPPKPSARKASSWPEPVSLIDVSATAAAVAGLEPPTSFQGDDLRALIDGAPRRAPVLSQMLLTEVDGTPYRQQTLLVDGDTRLMFDRVTGRAWLFELTSDPEQKDPLSQATLAGETMSLAEAVGYGRRIVEHLETQ